MEDGYLYREMRVLKASRPTEYQRWEEKCRASLMACLAWGSSLNLLSHWALVESDRRREAAVLCAVV